MLPHSKDYSAEVSFMQPEQKKKSEDKRLAFCCAGTC